MAENRKRCLFVSIPPTMKDNEVKGRDSEVLQFENDEITLDIEYGDYSADVISHLRDYEGQKEQTIISDEKIEIVTYDYNKPIFSETKMADTTKSRTIEKHFVIGVNFPRKAEVNSPDRPKISFVAKCKTLESQETAKTILHSIKFK